MLSFSPECYPDEASDADKADGELLPLKVWWLRIPESEKVSTLPDPFHEVGKRSTPWQ
jgi:hypothetical protein